MVHGAGLRWNDWSLVFDRGVQHSIGWKKLQVNLQMRITGSLLKSPSGRWVLYLCYGVMFRAEIGYRALKYWCWTLLVSLYFLLPSPFLCFVHFDREVGHFLLHVFSSANSLFVPSCEAASLLKWSSEHPARIETPRPQTPVATGASSVACSLKLSNVGTD